MKKRISLLSLCLGLFIAACTDSSGFEDLQNFSEKEVMPRAAGDGIYDVLGYGYDITSDYLGEASVRQPVLDVEAFIRDNKGRFDNPFIGTIEQKVTAGEDAWSFLQQTISNTNFSGSVAIIRKTKCFDFWERNVLFPKTKRSFFRTPTPSTLPFSA